MLTLAELERKILQSYLHSVSVEVNGVIYSLGKRVHLPIECVDVAWFLVSSEHLSVTGYAMEEVIAKAKNRGGPTAQTWLDPYRHMEGTDENKSGV